MIFEVFNTAITRTKQSMRLMVGVPDYEAYLNHMKAAHPERPVMSYSEFFRERQEARYGAKGRLNRCC
jgi:uncharacterized short protein YbdD (DUF466 family)